jgi:uncharacterized membrane protein
MTTALRPGGETAIDRITHGAIAAPTLMALGMEGPGRTLYTVYSFMCHQLPQRSYFLFGPQLVQTYSWDQLLASGMNPMWPRQFLGTAQLGYKVAFAHRLTAMYSSLLAGGLLFGLLRGRVNWHVSIPGYLLAWLFLALDGGSHLVSELTGWGFRADNEWLRALTGNALPVHFYGGDGIGSFNWLMRTVSGALVGLATAWFVLPVLQRGVREIVSLTQDAGSRPGGGCVWRSRHHRSHKCRLRVRHAARWRQLSLARGFSIDSDKKTPAPEAASQFTGVEQSAPALGYRILEAVKPTTNECQLDNDPEDLVFGKFCKR